MTITTFRDGGGVASPPLALLRETEEFGIRVCDLVSPPARFWAGARPRPTVMHGVDQGHVTRDAAGLALLAAPPDETVTAQSRRTLARVLAWFLLAEDPQRRLDARAVSTLAHQASLVRHVLTTPALHRVLIADEVGLGKTIEAALIVKELADADPGLRVLYLAPAGLVRNVHRELHRVGLRFRCWIAGAERDARLTDPLVLASIHRAVHPAHFDGFFAPGLRWDAIIVDECHHLSDWGPQGGKPTRKYKLVQELVRHSPEARVILMTGTPHQGHQARFENLVRLLRRGNEPPEAIAGRVIYRTKDDVRDWDGAPLFPGRHVHPPIVVELGHAHRAWLEKIHQVFEPECGGPPVGTARRRARSWRCGQALQWATSSVEAGLGFLIRQALRAGWTLDSVPLVDALAAIRPYRGGAPDEPVESLFRRMATDVERRRRRHGDDLDDLDDAEDLDGDDHDDADSHDGGADPALLAMVLRDGVRLLHELGDAKWERIRRSVLDCVPGDKVVLFAQPVETVTALARYLERIDGRKPAIVIGNQPESVREAEVAAFRRPDGPRFLVSSRAGGEGFNLQVAHVLVHVDVPWNPMELEQRVGRVHRFLSRRTIQVHTVVVSNSREVDIYGKARQKLQDIAGSLVEPERLEQLFARVMSLVPPDELQDVMVRRPLGPLDGSELAALSRLVTEGYRRWESFHCQYASAQQQIGALDPGRARWADLERFAADQLGARSVPGYQGLRFQLRGDEIVEASEDATVLDIDGGHFACGDFGGMPVVGSGSAIAAPLGLNVEPVVGALRAAGLPDRPTGAAYVRMLSLAGIPDHVRKPFGLLFYGRQGVRNHGGTWVESWLDLVVAVVEPGQAPILLDGDDRAAVVRGLASPTLRRDGQLAPALLDALRSADAQLFEQLRRPGEDRAMRFALFPVAAIIVD
jgi:superfamily II DNA or RNA helicase